MMKNIIRIGVISGLMSGVVFAADVQEKPQSLSIRQRISREGAVWKRGLAAAKKRHIQRQKLNRKEVRAYNAVVKRVGGLAALLAAIGAGVTHEVKRRAEVERAAAREAEREAAEREAAEREAAEREAAARAAAARAAAESGDDDSDDSDGSDDSDDSDDDNNDSDSSSSFSENDSESEGKSEEGAESGDDSDVRPQLSPVAFLYEGLLNYYPDIDDIDHVLVQIEADDRLDEWYKGKKLAHSLLVYLQRYEERGNKVGIDKTMEAFKQLIRKMPHQLEDKTIRSNSTPEDMLITSPSLVDKASQEELLDFIKEIKTSQAAGRRVKAARP